MRHGRDLAVKLHLLGRMQHPGRGDAYWPIIPRRIVSPYLHPVWWLDATSDIRRGWPRGRPRKPGVTPPARNFEAEVERLAATKTGRQMLAAARSQAEGMAQVREAVAAHWGEERS